jgi:hypothetical protein
MQETTYRGFVVQHHPTRCTATNGGVTLASPTFTGRQAQAKALVDIHAQVDQSWAQVEAEERRRPVIRERFSVKVMWERIKG